MRRHRSNDDSHHHWMGYTDILASSMLVLILVTVISALNNANNQKPPLIKLSESDSYRFPTGSFTLSPEYKNQLDEIMNTIVDNIMKFRVDTIEVIGHTDGQPSPGNSNLDLHLPHLSRQNKQKQAIIPGSNVDLGMLRAISVASYIREKLISKGVKSVPSIIPYSAASLVDPQGTYSPADTKVDKARRRIEIRFTRNQS